MKLSFDQLSACIHGAIELTRNPDDSVQIHRFTDAQKAIYTPKDAGYFASNQSANTTFDICTDADSITLTFSGRCREQCPEIPADILVNGVLQHHVQATRTAVSSYAVVPYDPVSFTIPLPGGEKRVTVYFGYITTVDSLTVDLPDGAFVRTYSPKRTMVSFGDSITQGLSAQFPSMSYISQLSRKLDAAVYNFGIGGERFRADKIVPGTYPECDLVTVAYGTNDFGQKKSCTADFEANMAAFFRLLHEVYPETPTFVLLPLWRVDETELHNDIPTLQAVRDRIRQEVQQYANITVIDCKNFVPHLPAFFADGIVHPNDLGMTHYATNLYLAIKEVLK